MRRKSLKGALTLGLLACASVFALGSFTPSEAGSEAPIPIPFCTDATLQGSYAYSRTGAFVGIGPVAANGVVTFNGQAELFGRDTASVNGKISERKFEGKYVVNGDCTGAATFFFSDREIVNIEFQIVDRGGEVRFIQTDDRTVVTGSAKKMAALFLAE